MEVDPPATPPAPPPRKPVRWLPVAAVLAGILTSGILLLSQRPKDTAVFMEAVNPLKAWRSAGGYQHGSWTASEGFWVGDVAELYRHGVLSRHVAEADTAPLHPLVDRPRPFHGYYLRAMEEGFGEIPLKGKMWSTQGYAFCIYPAELRPGARVWMVCDFGIFMKKAENTQPILRWPAGGPAGEWRRDWAIVD